MTDIAVWLFWATLVIWPWTPALAQGGSQSEVAISGQLEIARLLDLCAERLSLLIDYDAAAVRGTSTFRIGEVITDEQLWDLTNRALASHGLTTIRRPGADPNVISVVKLADAAGMAGLDLPTVHLRAGYVNVLVQIRNRPAKSIVEVLKPILSKPGGAIFELPDGLILISDLSTRVQEAQQIIARLDVASDAPIVQEFEPQFISAVALTALVNSTIAARDTMAELPLRGKVVSASDANAVIVICPPNELTVFQEMIKRLDRSTPAITKNYAIHHFDIKVVASLIEQTLGKSVQKQSAPADSWRLVVDPLTGTLIINASPADHERIGTLIDRLNSVPSGSRRPMRAFTLKNRSAADVVEVVRRLIGEGALAASTESPGNNSQSADAEPRIFSMPPSRDAISTRDSTTDGATARQPLNAIANARAPYTQSADSATRVVEPSNSRTNSQLSITADEETNSIIAIGDPRLLSQLEEIIRGLDVRQAQVMIEIIVVNLSEADTLDLGIELKKIELSGGTAISLSSLFGLGTPSAFGVSGATPSLGRGFTGAVLNPGDFSVVVRALETINQGRTLSWPKVLVNNNQQAVLDSVLQQPFISVNASDTIATTSFGGSESAGSIITVKPHIAEGDHLVLEYSVTLSAFVGDAADPSLPPPKQSNNLSSVVTIPDGYTVVVGGLEMSNETRAVSQIPFLGDVPLLGEAFKSRSNSDSTSRFFVFIKSQVMRHNGFEDLKYLTAPDLTAAEIDDDWPVVEPRIIR